MHPVFTIGLLLTFVGFSGYVYGITAAYPGRALSLTALMIGITLAAIGLTSEEAGS
jgi:hypothetical protein